MNGIAGWWDSFELWVAGLPFIPQFLVVLIGMVPISFALAYLLDRGLRGVLRLLGERSVIAAHSEDMAVDSSGFTSTGVPDTVPSEEELVGMGEAVEEDRVYAESGAR